MTCTEAFIKIDMKMIMAFVRPERVEKVASMLGEGGFASYTRADVYGRGKQRGVQVLGQRYDMPKTMLMKLPVTYGFDRW